MRIRNTPAQFGFIAQALHWATAVLVAIQAWLGVTGANLPLGIERLITLARHKSLGMTVLLLVVLRLAWRIANPPPPFPATMTAREQWLARSVHRAFYGVLILLPVIGWIASSASNLTVSWFGWFTFPDLVGVDPALAKTAKAVHRGLSYGLLALVALHVAAVFRHQWLLRDGLFWRMAPRSGAQGP